MYVMILSNGGQVLLTSVEVENLAYHYNAKVSVNFERYIINFTDGGEYTFKVIAPIGISRETLAELGIK